MDADKNEFHHEGNGKETIGRGSTRMNADKMRNKDKEAFRTQMNAEHADEERQKNEWDADERGLENGPKLKAQG
jgi:hypothetical protein